MPFGLAARDFVAGHLSGLERLWRGLYPSKPERKLALAKWPICQRREPFRNRVRAQLDDRLPFNGAGRELSAEDAAGPADPVEPLI